ncbi:hypothetical protein PAHAL_5G003700 [Panicum hallii]|uniref:Di19 zinc-binding domain-containing protein n=1 Tax=Panicum hallii TaxID=206008 RepID=A0A2S3HMR4_9POAL|nr:hypothetical protein PAHAL_5G003700 [Panicum hallii]
MCCSSSSVCAPPSFSSSLLRQLAAMEVEACYNYGFLPADRGRHQPPPPPPYGHGPSPPHPAEDGELWEYFPCPFCYIEVEVPFICNHLQEEHCFDTRNAVCPICANNLGKDMAAHFRVQHSHLLKRRKPSKPSSWPAAATNSASRTGTATSSAALHKPTMRSQAIPTLRMVL